MNNKKTINALRLEIFKRLDDRKISDDVFAGFAGIGVNTIKNVFKGHDCRVSTLIKICDALDIELSFKQ